MSVERYALYFAPEDGSDLARFGWAWLGRRPRDEECLPIPEDRASIVADARIYGFHATLKPPFRLSDPGETDRLMEEAARFAAARAPFVLPPLVLADLHGFLALRPEGRPDALHALADDCVRHFDSFRAPPSTADLEKRLAAGLDEAQRAHLARWGYPYVFDEFRFHMTLTRRLEPAEHETWRREITALAAPALAEAVAVRSLCLFRQAGAGRPFTLARRFPLGG